MHHEARYRLADSTVVEPLVNQWFAWSSTIAPVPASLHLTQYQIPLLESYLSDPEVHVAASNTPEFVGGPFANTPPEAEESIRRLLEQTRKTLAPNIEFAKDIFQFLDFLLCEGQGQTLEPFYKKAPASMRGFVELFYDYCHRPSFRFLKSLLYE